jgi:glutamine synthetase
MSPADVLKLIKEKGVKFVDLRFTDTRGKEQHVTVPSHTVDAAMFEDGKMFDGSSIAGWKGINESDMILGLDPSTAVLDPFMEETTMIIRCDIIEPSTMQGYERDPRSAAKRAEAYMRSTGIADEAFFGPENEFFIFDDVRWASQMQGAFYAIDSYEGAWQSGKEIEEGNLGHRPASRAATSPSRRSTRCRTSAPRCAWRSRRWASSSRCTTTRSRRPASARSASGSARS